MYDSYSGAHRGPALVYRPDGTTGIARFLILTYTARQRGLSGWRDVQITPDMAALRKDLGGTGTGDVRRFAERGLVSIRPRD
ncbi:hypothetical protein GCM10009753_55450 [Streptantibioticus ferralitis]